MKGGPSEGTHIRFVPIDVPSDRKTAIWLVRSKYDDGGLLGQIAWFGRWRKYSFFASPDCVFEEVCMREISQFIVDRTREHRAGKSA